MTNTIIVAVLATISTFFSAGRATTGKPDGFTDDPPSYIEEAAQGTSSPIACPNA